MAQCCWQSTLLGIDNLLSSFTCVWVHSCWNKLQTISHVYQHPSQTISTKQYQRMYHHFCQNQSRDAKSASWDIGINWHSQGSWIQKQHNGLSTYQPWKLIWQHAIILHLHTHADPCSIADGHNHQHIISKLQCIVCKTARCKSACSKVTLMHAWTRKYEYMHSLSNSPCCFKVPVCMLGLQLTLHLFVNVFAAVHEAVSFAWVHVQGDVLVAGALHLLNECLDCLHSTCKCHFL